MWQVYFGFCSDLLLFSFVANKTRVLLMKLVSYTLMACTLNKVLRTKISESPPLAPSLGTGTSLRSRRLELVGARKDGGARVSLSRACSFFHPNTSKRLLRRLDTHMILSSPRRTSSLDLCSGPALS